MRDKRWRQVQGFLKARRRASLLTGTLEGLNPFSRDRATSPEGHRSNLSRLASGDYFCSCRQCKGHKRRYLGNSVHAIPIQELKERQDCE